MAIRQVPKCFDTSGARFILIQPNSKIPYDTGWNKIGGKNYTFEEINELLAEDTYKDFNVGKVLGAGEVDIEFDTQDAQDKYQPLLGETLQFKSAIKGGFHNIFISDIKLTTAINDSDGKRAVDILAGKMGSEGKYVYSQALIPPSFIKTDSQGNEVNRSYEITKDLPPKYISEEEINNIFGLSKQEEVMVVEHTMKDIGPIRDEIRKRVTISSQLEKYKVPVKNRARYNTICPLVHKDKNGKDLISTSGANFHVDEEKHSWYCHNDVCKKGGDVLTLRSLKEGKPIEEVAEEFAKELGLQYESRKDTDKVWIKHPGPGRLHSEMIKEVAEVLHDKNKIFLRPESQEIVELTRLKEHELDTKTYEGFQTVKPNRFITLIENYITPFITIKNPNNGNFIEKEKSISAELANTILTSEELKSSIQPIRRLFTVPIPIIYKGELTFPKKGYDERFNSWLSNDAPDLSNPNMGIQEAQSILKNIYKEFCFQDKQDYHNAIAGLITPYLKGLYPQFNTRAPIFCYLANRERSGKDYCAGVTGIVYENSSLEEPPISTGESAYNDTSNELRKKILSGFMSGRQRLHFANNKGFINNSTLEAVATSKSWSDRQLGKSENLVFDNTMDFSLSGNVGITYTPDLANRMVFVNLFLDIEDANARRFNNPNLHEYVSKRRGEILSALYALVRNWIDKGSNPGSIAFTSFPEWARVCGGILEAAGFNSPCIKNDSLAGEESDPETAEMKELFSLCYANHPDVWISKKVISDLIQGQDEIFTYIDFNSKAGITKFGMKLRKYIGRIQSGILLKVNDVKERGFRQKFVFTKQLQKDLINAVFE